MRYGVEEYPDLGFEQLRKRQRAVVAFGERGEEQAEFPVENFLEKVFLCPEIIVDQRLGTAGLLGDFGF